MSPDKKQLLKKMTMSKESRGRIQVDESRIWNMGFSNVKRLSYSTAYMSEELHIVKMPNIRGTHRNLSIMSPAEKNRYLRLYTRYIHTTN